MTTSTTPTTGHTLAADIETWEYMYHTVPMGQFSTEIHTINRVGAEGWELVNGLAITGGSGWTAPGQTLSILLLFKRRRR